MGFGLYKETIGDILQTFFISAKLNFKQVEIILHDQLNLQLCHSPSKTYKTLSSISFTTNRKIGTDSNSAPIALGLGTMGEGIVGVSFL